MTISLHNALTVGRKSDTATSVDLIEARRLLRSVIEDCEAALTNVEREMKGRMAAHRAGEMNAELPPEQAEVMRLKGMI